MTKGIENTLGLRSLEEALAQFGASPKSLGTASQEIVPVDEPADEADQYEYDDDPILDQKIALSMDRERREVIADELLNGADTERDLDDVSYRLIRHAETMAELALELDPGRAPRAFEVTNALLKNHMDAVISKRELRLKTMKVLQDQRKLELDERKLELEERKHAGKSDSDENPDVIQAHATVISSADLLRTLHAEMKDLHKEPPPQGDI